MGGAAELAAVFSISIVSLVLLAWYSVSKAIRSGGKTWIEVRAAGIVHFKFGTEINPAQGDRSANEQAQLKSIEVVEPELPPSELPPGRRRWRWPRKRAPSGGEA